MDDVECSGIDPTPGPSGASPSKFSAPQPSGDGGGANPSQFSVSQPSEDSGGGRVCIDVEALNVYDASLLIFDATNVPVYCAINLKTVLPLDTW